ncbi:YitT family protein [Sporosarcina sp. G11-34]|uniref:YitT family protein n=1 Tax=Sporosarcina sp. G11-34 TaxID=2849605 RepID=UPI002E767CD6|nr:YitT family protein [Sporosarcina sp. G11-34]
MKKTITILIGSLLIAIGINLFLVPYKLLEGGAIGISLVFHYLFGVKVGLTYLLISIPIFIIAWFFYRTFFYNGIHGMLLSSLIIDLLYPLHYLGRTMAIAPILSAALGGIFIGAGVGIMFLHDISDGGIDLLAQMVSKKLKLNPGLVIFGFDIVIVSIGSMLLISTHLILSYVTVLFVGVTTSYIVSKKSRPSTRT